MPWVFAWFACLAFSASPAEAQRPNFVWLVAEDTSKHFLEPFDRHGAPTPHVARLAAEGVLFERAFSNASVCSVARTTLMTGCYAPRLGAQFHRPAVSVPLPGDLRLFPHALAQAGYYTANHHKKDYNVVEGEGVWHASSRRASWRERRPGQPFFYMQSFGMSHESALHFGPRALEEEPTRTDPTSVFLAPIHPDTPVFRYTTARFHDRVRAVDEALGEVLEALEREGLLETTFVFVFGDHGGALPGSKGTWRETGLHVPLVVRIPERFREHVPWDAGARTRAFVSFVDFAPTVLHLAGLAVPEGMDGAAFLGRDLDRAALEERDATFSSADRFDEQVDFVRAVRRGRFKLVRRFRPYLADALHNDYRARMLARRTWEELFRAGRLDPLQRAFFLPRRAESLYDVEADPFETRDLADDPAHRETRLALRAQLAAWMRAQPDLSVFPESVLVTQALERPAAFGAAHRARIARCLDVADLALEPFPRTAEALAAALGDADPWVRFWALEVVAGHGPAAASLASVVERLRNDDPERLVRVLAACCSARQGRTAAVEAIVAELAQSTSPVEANLVLNTLVHLRDDAGLAVRLDAAALRPEVRDDPNVALRLRCLGAR